MQRKEEGCFVMWQINLAEEPNFWVFSSPPITFTVLPILTFATKLFSQVLCSSAWHISGFRRCSWSLGILTHFFWSFSVSQEANTYPRRHADPFHRLPMVESRYSFGISALELNFGHFNQYLDTRRSTEFKTHKCR